MAVVLIRGRLLVLVAAALMAAMMGVLAVPTVAQTNKPGEEKAVAQVEEKRKPEEKKMTKEQGPPQTGSILLGLVVGALLVGGGAPDTQGQFRISSGGR